MNKIRGYVFAEIEDTVFALGGDCAGIQHQQTVIVFAVSRVGMAVKTDVGVLLFC